MCKFSVEGWNIEPVFTVDSACMRGRRMPFWARMWLWTRRRSVRVVLKCLSSPPLVCGRTSSFCCMGILMPCPAWKGRVSVMFAVKAEVWSVSRSLCENAGMRGYPCFRRGRRRLRGCFLNLMLASRLLTILGLRTGPPKFLLSGYRAVFLGLAEEMFLWNV